MAEHRLSAVRGMVPALTAIPLVFASWALLMPVVPLAMARNGASTTIASLSTAIFMTATVLAQLATVPFLRELGYRPVILVGAVLMALPCPLMLLSPNMLWWFAIAVVRGVGFGFVTVACASLPARLTPPELLGRAAGAQGMAMSFAQAVGLGAGLAIDHVWDFRTVCLVGLVLPLVGCVVLVRVPATSETGRAGKPSNGSRGRAGRIGPITLMVVIATTFGGLSVLLPIGYQGDQWAAAAALTLLSLGAIVGRLAAGHSSDRGRHGRFATGGVLMAALAMVLLSVADEWSLQIVSLYIGATVFGLGFGVVQNDTIVSLFRAYSSSGRVVGAKWWNVAIDLGVGVGAFGFGLAASLSGTAGAYLLAAVSLAILMPVTHRCLRLPAAKQQA